MHRINIWNCSEIVKLWPKAVGVLHANTRFLIKPAQGDPWRKRERTLYNLFRFNEFLECFWSPAKWREVNMGDDKKLDKVPEVFPDPLGDVLQYKPCPKFRSYRIKPSWMSEHESQQSCHWEYKMYKLERSWECSAAGWIEKKISQWSRQDLWNQH